MNEPIIKDSIFLSPERIAYKIYVEQAKKYTIPLTFEKWQSEINNLKVGC